jgi:diguanylate cyclase (GGDEF)-like protein/PAS domain S-box-containing protein
MLQANPPMPAEPEINRRSYFPAGLRTFRRIKLSLVAAFVAGLAMTLVMLSGMTDLPEQRLSDAWFSAGNIAPSGRIVLVTFDHSAARYATTNRVSHRDLAELLLKLDTAGASHILIDFSLSEQTNEADDRYLERALMQLGRKVGLTALAVPSVNQQGWRRTAPLDRFARPVTKTTSDLALDNDGELRNFGIDNSGLRKLISGPAWLNDVRKDDYAAADRNDFRIDFGIDLRRIPRVDAVAALQGNFMGAELSGAKVIIAGFSPPTGGGYRVPRYGELTHAEITALAAETLALGRDLRTVPRTASTLGLIALAALMGLLCAGRAPRTGASFCSGVALFALGLGAGLQTLIGLMAPSAGVVAAVLAGFASAQVVVHPALQRVRHAVWTVLANIDIGLARALESTSDGLLIFDREGRLLSINSSARQLLAVEPKGSPDGISLAAMLGPQADAVMSAVRDRQNRRVRTMIRKNGVERHLEFAVNAIPGGGADGGIATVRDVTEQHAQLEALKFIATRDPLTGLANRRAFEKAAKSARGTIGAPLALFICDLDGFKPVNDTWGHHAGDAILREIGNRLVAEAPAHAVVARLGGDEFGVLIAHSSEALAIETARRLVSRIRQPVEINSERITVGVSIGIALDTERQDIHVLMECADAAMYEAKRAGCGYELWRPKQLPNAAAQPTLKSAEIDGLSSRAG